ADLLDGDAVTRRRPGAREGGDQHALAELDVGTRGRVREAGGMPLPQLGERVLVTDDDELRAADAAGVTLRAAAIDIVQRLEVEDALLAEVILETAFLRAKAEEQHESHRQHAFHQVFSLIDNIINAAPGERRAQSGGVRLVQT